MPILIGAMAAMGAIGFGAFDYFTAPERVFGTKMLRCSATEITWQSGPGPETVINGCGKSITAWCDENECREPGEPGL